MSATETGLDLEEIRRRRVGGMKPSDELVDALVAEIDRLRAENDRLVECYDRDQGFIKTQQRGLAELRGQVARVEVLLSEFTHDTGITVVEEALWRAALAEPVEQEAGR